MIEIQKRDTEQPIRFLSYSRRPLWDWLTLEGWAWLVVGILAACLVLAILSLRPVVCHGGWCPDIKCFGSGICRPCACMSRDYSGGVCVDIESREAMAERGYSEMR